jgi:FlaG/FlaF family flagellin (archaellin)
MRSRFRRRAAGGRRPRADGRGVSDVIGTILLLGITVTLFGAVFFFVNAFPKPPAQANSQFSASLTYGGTGGNQVTAVSITHLAGPTLYAAQTQIYLASQAHPTAFTGKNPYTIGSGLASATAWGVGQVWTVSLTALVPALTTPDNVTISIVSSGQLLFRNVLPGSNPNIPPQFVNQGTTPASPGVGQSLTIYAQIVDDDLNTHSVYVNVTQIPGASAVCPKSCQMTYNAASGTYQYVVAAGVSTTAGTFFVFINATDIAKQPNSVVIPVSIGVGAASAAGPVGAQLALNQTAPVNNTPVALVATVSDTASVGGTLNVTFRWNGTTIASVLSSVGPGSTVSVSQTWTPTKKGAILLSATANITGVGSSTATLNVTVFPPIELIAHNVPAGGGYGPSNASAFLANELTAAGIPFTMNFIACGAALPASYAPYKVAIIDFGSNTSSGCSSPSATDQANMVAAGIRFWVVGANAWSATSCGSYSSAYLSLFGISTSGSASCSSTLSGTAPYTANTYTAAASQGLLGNGMPASFTINGTLAGSTTFGNAYYFVRSVTNTYVTSSGGKPIGIWQTSGGVRQATLGTDPALLQAQLPSTNFWGTGAVGSALAYNVVDWLAGVTSPASAGRAAVDFAVSQATLAGTTHAAPSSVYVALRANGLAGGAVTVALYVNGAPALYQGTVASATTVLSGSGGWSFVTLVWQAPSAGSYTLSVALISASGDTVAVNNQLAVGVEKAPGAAPGAPVVFA